MCLLGPPQLRHLPTSMAAAATSAKNFVNLMDANFNKSRPPMGLTENRSRTFLSSGNPCLDFFYQVVPSTRPSSVTSLLSSAWAYNPLPSLKLVANLRAVRGTGKSDREGFYACALWMHENHPKTLALNVAPLADFGYMKDLLEILYRLIRGFDTRKLAEEARTRTMHRNRVAYKKIRDPTPEEAAVLRRSKRAELAGLAVERYIKGWK